MSEIARLEAVLTAKTDDLKRGLSEAQRGVTSLRDEFKSLNGLNPAPNMAAFKSAMAEVGATLQANAGKMQEWGTALTIGVTAPLVAMAVGSTKAASDLTESMNKVGVVFGKTADTVQAFSATSAKSLGISKREALEASATFGNLLQSVGVGKAQTAGMSTALVQLAADLASFNNIDPSVALEKLRSGLVGEAEPLRTVGILLSETAVKAEALRMGLGNAKGELTETQKVMARYSLIMQQSTTAQGDFARTSDGLANSTRIAKAELEDASAALGEKLIPFAVTATGEVSKLAEAFAGMSPDAQQAAVNIGLIAVAAGPLLNVLGTIIKLAPLAGAALGAILGSSATPIVGGALVMTGVALKLGQQTTTLSPEQASGINALNDPRKQLAEVQGRITQLQALMKQNPGDSGLALELGHLMNQASILQGQIAQLGSTGQANLHLLAGEAGTAATAVGQIATAAANAITNVAQLAGYLDLVQKLPQGVWTNGTYLDAMGRDLLRQQETGGTTWGPLLQAGQRTNKLQNAVDAHLIDEIPMTIKNALSAMGNNVSNVTSAFDRFADRVTSAIDDASNAGKGLFNLTAGTGGAMAPGANGPFERLYRVLDVAKLGDKSPWSAGEGLTQEQAKQTGRAFEMGDIFSPEVFKRVDWDALAKTVTDEQRFALDRQYAGQAAAGLKAAGKPLTSENMSAAIDQLAAKDKDGMLPKLDAISGALGSGSVIDKDLVNVVNAIKGIGNPGAPSGNTPTPQPPASGIGPGPVPSFAVGTSYAPSGLAYVHQDELIDLPGPGAHIYTAHQTQQMMGGDGSVLQQLRDDLRGDSDSMREQAAELAEQFTTLAALRVSRSMLRAQEQKLRSR